MEIEDNTCIIKHSLRNTFTDDVDEFFFGPALRHATSYDCMMGYFNSSSFQVIAKSLLVFLKSDLKYKMRFIISPNLSKQDLNILLKWYEDPTSIYSLIANFQLNEESLKKNTLLALAFLLKNDQIEIKIALPKNGLFHVKCWLFKQKTGEEVIIHGSGNHTFSGLNRNFEYLVAENSAHSITEKTICENIRKDFNMLWANKYKDVICGSLTVEMINALLLLSKDYERVSSCKKEIIRNLENALNDINRTIEMDEENSYTALENILKAHTSPDLTIPEWLNYREGDYTHQGEAIDAWFKNDCLGILSIATGGGKTLTSLAAASLLSKQLGNLLVIVAVPTIALMNQWTNEIALFNVTAINTNGLSKAKKIEAIDLACKNLKFRSSKTEVIILTHDALQSEVMTKIEKFSRKLPTLLIADEVHNLGSLGFSSSPPTFFKYKLGLSATPVRQFDEDGTKFLLEYFGGVVYEFPLDKAIGKCLVEFNYFVHVAYLTAEEEEDFYEISKKIKKLSYAANLNKESEEFKLWSNLCIQRRRIIETAENKIKLFFETLPKSKTENAYTLIFCSDKNPEQLSQVNEFLNKSHVNYHQITSEETSNPKLLSKIVEDYNKGQIQVLTSKRVLDEGFNVPSTKNAYILASNTTKRQWVQRLGRVLRKAPDKDKATIHDFVVLPTLDSTVVDNEFKSLLRSEADRIRFFITYATNSLEERGSITALMKIANALDN